MQECPKQLGKIVNFQNKRYFAGLSGETKMLHRQAPDVFLRL